MAFGGGSGLDAGKVIAFMAGQTRPMWDFEDIGDWWTRANPAGIYPSIAVPTTAGTGSETGRASVITDEKTHTKKVIFHPKMMPAIVIADPELTEVVRDRFDVDRLDHAGAGEVVEPRPLLRGRRTVEDHLDLAELEGEWPRDSTDSVTFSLVFVTVFAALCRHCLSFRMLNHAAHQLCFVLIVSFSVSSTLETAPVLRGQ